MKKLYGFRGKRSSDEVREIALGAVRSQCRKNGFDPAELDANEALKVLDDFIRTWEMNGTYAQNFAYHASDHQIELFKQDWENWRKEQQTR